MRGEVQALLFAASHREPILWEWSSNCVADSWHAEAMEP